MQFVVFFLLVFQWRKFFGNVFEEKKSFNGNVGEKFSEENELKERSLLKSS
jgi:hypothetical protein